MVIGRLTPDILREYCMQFVGLPYRWGGDDTIEGFDCSGLVQEILSAVGIDPPGDQTAQHLYNYFKEHGRVSLRDFGALSFYGRRTKINHVGFCLNSDLMIEAGGGGSRTTSPSAASAHNAYIRIRPIHNRNDLVDVLMPKYSWIE